MADTHLIFKETENFKAVLPFDWNDVKIDITNRGVVVTMPMQSDEKIYGLGLPSKTFLQNVRCIGFCSQCNRQKVLDHLVEDIIRKDYFIMED